MVIAKMFLCIHLLIPIKELMLIKDMAAARAALDQEFCNGQLYIDEQHCI